MHMQLDIHKIFIHCRIYNSIQVLLFLVFNYCVTLLLDNEYYLVNTKYHLVNTTLVPSLRNRSFKNIFK